MKILKKSILILLTFSIICIMGISCVSATDNVDPTNSEDISIVNNNSQNSVNLETSNNLVDGDSSQGLLTIPNEVNTNNYEPNNNILSENENQIIAVEANSKANSYIDMDFENSNNTLEFDLSSNDIDLPNQIITGDINGTSFSLTTNYEGELIKL
ncbi:hypothetical protein [Methanobrevibacter sp. UBA412]|uniref:hypothetical protein n=1 Tax=Methanobrevibacter sp. UBA412 TaxID=1915486 RepID=UPI0039B96252